MDEKNRHRRIMAAPGTAPSPVASALERYVRERLRCLTEARRILGLNELDMITVLHISRNPGVRPTDLRHHIGITSAGVTTVVDRLVQRDILRREVDPDDRRVSHLYAEVDVTSEPWNCLTRFDDTFNRALEQLQPEVLDEVSTVLNTATTFAELK